MQTGNSNLMTHHSGEIGPYTPCFLDRFMDLVRRLPIPYWLTYLGLLVVQSLIVHILAWLSGWLPAYRPSPILFLFPVWLWGPLAMMTHLKSVSREALTGFAPLLEVEEETLKRLEYEFTVMPAASVVLSGVFWAIVYFLLTYWAYDAFYVGYGLGTWFSVVIFVEGLISYSVGSAIYYYSLRQLRLVNLTVKMVKQFNLFRLDPVYAFSRVTSQIGVTWMIMLSLTLLLFPIQLATIPVLAVLVVQLALAVAAFVLPLWFVNRRLVAEKRRLLAELDRRVESTLARLHRHLDQDEIGALDPINSAMTGLRAEREVLTGIPTWPWRSGTLAGFLSAIVLPLALYLVQLVVEKWLGG